MHPETKGKDEIIAVSSALLRSPSEHMKQMRPASARPANVRAINKCSESEAAPSADVSCCQSWETCRAPGFLGKMKLWSCASLKGDSRAEALWKGSGCQAGF